MHLITPLLLLISLLLIPPSTNSTHTLFTPGKPIPRNINTGLSLPEQCRLALRSSSRTTQWNKARRAVGLREVSMDKSYFKVARKIQAFYSFSAGISLFNMSNTLVPYLLVWKAGNDAIRGNLLKYEERFVSHKTKGECHAVYCSDPVKYLMMCRSRIVK
jgi:hypothetical protein